MVRNSFFDEVSFILLWVAIIMFSDYQTCCWDREWDNFENRFERDWLTVCKPLIACIRPYKQVTDASKKKDFMGLLIIKDHFLESFPNSS